VKEDAEDEIKEADDDPKAAKAGDKP